MSRFKLICDNGQELTTDMKDGDERITIEGEIIKLEEFFIQLANDKIASGIHPAGWVDPLPNKIISHEKVE
jgi:hypothetical protein